MRLRTGSLIALAFISATAFANRADVEAKGCRTNPKSGSSACPRRNDERVPSRPPSQASEGQPGYFANCAAAHAAGVAPLRRGAPGYRPGLDRDNDGIACE